MRLYLVILIACLGLFTEISLAEEVLLGTVRSVARDAGEIRLEVAGKGGFFSFGGSTEEIVVHAEPSMIPEDLQQGQVIRVWGDFVEDKTFDARFVKGRCMGRCDHGDPTGVRSRLGRGRGWGGGHGKGRH